VEREQRTIASGRNLEAHEKNLHPARGYCYRVRATDPAGNKSEWAQVCATTPDLTPPSTPGHLAMVPRAATQVVAVWEPSQDDVGVVGYEIVRGEEVVASLAKTSTIVSGLAARKEHCLGVRALDAAGNRSPVAGPLCVTTPDVATPPAPVNLRVETVAGGGQLRWEPSPQAGVVYAVYQGDARRVGITSAESYAVKGALFGRGSCYRVAAMDGAGRESPKTIPACAAGEGAVTVR
jgi:hypothetical protein